jgi:hypothetical protein
MAAEEAEEALEERRGAARASAASAAGAARLVVAYQGTRRRWRRTGGQQRQASPPEFDFGKERAVVLKWRATSTRSLLDSDLHPPKAASARWRALRRKRRHGGPGRGFGRARVVAPLAPQRRLRR